MMSICADEVFVLSRHATTRMAQRGIRRASLDLVLLHGRRTRAQNDCEEYILSGQAVRYLKAAGYDGEVIAAAIKVRAIVDTIGNVVTCYHQRKYRSRLNGRAARPRRLRSA